MPRPGAPGSRRTTRTSKGAWLVAPRPGSGLELIGYEDAILQALCFGWIDGPVRSFDEQTGGPVVRAASAVERVGGDEQGAPRSLLERTG